MGEGLTGVRPASQAPMGLRSNGTLQAVFDERVASVLVRLGVPSREDLQALCARLDGLLAGPAGRAGRPPKRGARKAAAGGAAARNRA